MPKGFRDLEIWQDANRLAIEMHKIIKSFPSEEKFALGNQLRRSAVSVSANIAESCGRYGTKDKVQLLMIARGSIFETRSHLSIAQGLEYIIGENFLKYDDAYEMLTKKLNAFISYLRSHDSNQPTN